MYNHTAADNIDVNVYGVVVMLNKHSYVNKLCSYTWHRSNYTRQTALGLMLFLNDAPFANQHFYLLLQVRCLALHCKYHAGVHRSPIEAQGHLDLSAHTNYAKVRKDTPQNPIFLN
jgi:hypothetical protein